MDEKELHYMFDKLVKVEKNNVVKINTALRKPK